MRLLYKRKLRVSVSVGRHRIKYKEFYYKQENKTNNVSLSLKFHVKCIYILFYFICYKILYPEHVDGLLRPKHVAFCSIINAGSCWR
jgi:hypothetical protein